MRRVIISKGHNPSKKGASDGHGFNEYDEAVKWVAKLTEIAKTKADLEIIEVPTGSLQSKINFINKECKRTYISLALEIHFNSCASAKVKGSETLFCPGSRKGKKAALTIQNAIASLMPPNRGIKEGWYRMDRPGFVDYVGDIDGDESIDAFLTATSCTALILEPEFIQNRSTIEANRDICCEVIINAIMDFLNDGKEA